MRARYEKRKLIYGFLTLAVIVLIAFFPAQNTVSISGEGEVLTANQEKIGTCSLSIEIQETKSLAVTYRRTVSLVLDGERLPDFLSSSGSETEDVCFISQMYYDPQEDRINSCDLFYQKDLSYARIHWDDKLYVISKLFHRSLINHPGLINER